MESFTIVSLITGIVCYALGMAVGLYLNRSSREENIREAFEHGRREGRAEMEVEKQSVGRAVTEKLAKMRDTLVDTYTAYEQAVELVEEKLNPGAIDQLRLDYSRGTSEEIRQELDFEPQFETQEEQHPAQRSLSEKVRSVSTQVPRALATSAAAKSAENGLVIEPEVVTDEGELELGSESSGEKSGDSVKAGSAAISKSSAEKPLSSQIAVENTSKGEEADYEPSTSLEVRDSAVKPVEH